MNKTQMFNKASRAFHTVGLKLRKHSPELLVVGGIVTGIAATVSACKATTKASKILENAKNEIETFTEVIEHPELVNEPYTEEDLKQDTKIIYAHAALDIAKVYAPAVGLGVLSVAAILSGHNIMRKRNMALAAAYNIVDQGFKEYRGRVVERFGEAMDKELRYDIKAKEIEEVVTNEDGTESVVTKTVDVAEGVNRYSGFARVYDDGCNGWTKDPQSNMKFLRMQEDYLTDRLRREKVLFLNDAYVALGFPRTREGNEFGWIYDDKNPNGDNYVDFGIFDVYCESNRRFINGYERNIILDFNVDGYILDKI